MTLGTELEQGGGLLVSGVAVLKPANDVTPPAVIEAPAQRNADETAAASRTLVAPYVRPHGGVAEIDPSDGGRNDR